MAEKPTRLLIVDDSALYRQMIRNVLRDFPDVSIVGVARDGMDALKKIEEFDPDLLTLDVQMPDMDGISVLREINRRSLRSKRTRGLRRRSAPFGLVNGGRAISHRKPTRRGEYSAIAL